ncbi:MAG: hypothetical protein Q7T91_10845 [Sulfuricurvum sp.]|nr:hypothetical protein [Sulfuricurvum sp.]
MEVFLTIGGYLLNAYIFILVAIKGFFLLFTSNSVAGFATGFTVLFFIFSFFVRTWSFDRSFLDSLKNPSIIVVTLLGTLLWVWITKDSDFGFVGDQRYNAKASLFIVIIALSTAGELNGEVIAVERGIRRSRKKYYDDED